jgi:hypothetical protein
MASQYYITIYLDPHYQRFLRSQFSCEKEIFEFPARHFFNTMIEHFVTTRPKDYSEPEKSEFLFKIALPNFEYKNEAHFRYLTCVKETILKSKIKEYYDWIIKDKIEAMLKHPGSLPDKYTVKLNRNECTQILIDEYGFDNAQHDSFDRLYKLFTRYKQKERNRRFRHRCKEVDN